MNGQSTPAPHTCVPQLSSPATTCTLVRTIGETYATAGHSALIASASSTVRLDCPVKPRMPPEVAAPGKIMMKFDPRELMVFWIDCDAPAPMGTTSMTQPTEKMMAGMVSGERTLSRVMEYRV